MDSAQFADNVVTSSGHVVNQKPTHYYIILAMIFLPKVRKIMANMASLFFYSRALHTTDNRHEKS